MPISERFTLCEQAFSWFGESWLTNYIRFNTTYLYYMMTTVNCSHGPVVNQVVLLILCIHFREIMSLNESKYDIPLSNNILFCSMKVSSVKCTVYYSNILLMMVSRMGKTRQLLQQTYWSKQRKVHLGKRIV